MRKETLLTVLLVLLLAVSAIQAVQLSAISNGISQGSYELKSSDGQAASGQSSSQTALPSNLQNLPSMVGGC